jgi:hypothetical protein
MIWPIVISNIIDMANFVKTRNASGNVVNLGARLGYNASS